MKKLKTTAFSVALLFSAALAFTSCGGHKNEANEDSKEVAEDQNKEKFDSTDLKKDSEWAVNVADASMLEVQLGKLAEANGSSSQVKELGKMMVADHTKAGEELAAAASQKNISLPSSLSEKCQKKYNDLAQKHGADFDKAYTSLMVDDHKDTIDAFKKEAKDGKDADLKTWAEGKIPTLEHHLEMSKAAKEAVHKS